MNRKKTLDEVIAEVLGKAGESLRVEEIYQRIIEDGLYKFKSENPVHIVRTALRRKSQNLELKNSKTKRIYFFLPNGTYNLINIEQAKKESQFSPKITRLDSRRNGLLDAHQEYITAFKEEILSDLKKLDPLDFEIFCGNFLKAYGFKKINITPKTKDGGLDGYGELKIGLTWMPIAFECKRYSGKSIGSPMVNQFRGSIQGEYPYGIYFTTSTYTKEAKTLRFKPGATPIVMIDGKGMVDLMIEKQFGVDKEVLPIYSNALDLIMVNK